MNSDDRLEDKTKMSGKQIVTIFIVTEMSEAGELAACVYSLCRLLSYPSRQTRFDYKKSTKSHFYLPDLDVPLVIDLAVPFQITYSLLHIPASNWSRMNPDHDRKDSVYPTEYLLNSLVISDPPSL